MILYILLSIVILLVLCFLYIRLKYKFWALQPVFHFYDIYYWFINVGIINKDLPVKNKYVNTNKIITKSFDNLNELTKKEMVNLIQMHYFINKENKYAPKQENIYPYFIGHNHPVYWSYYLEPELLIDNKTNKCIEDNRIIGCITSRPLHVSINRKKRDAKFDVYYVDYLCVNKYWRKRNIAPQLIQTHEYNQSHNNKKICVSLFKREEELTGIIPLTVYKTYCFFMKDSYIYQPLFLNPKITILTGDKQNMYYLYNFINEQHDKWDITIYPAISNIIELITSKNMFVKMLVVNGDIEVAFIFRKTCTYIENNGEIISCLASIISKDTSLTNDEIIAGFNNSLLSLLKEETNKKVKYISIEDISDNNDIIEYMYTIISPIVVSPMAYFFYNFAYSPFKSEKCLIIN